MPTGVESLSKSENLQDLIDTLAERLQRSVALDDPALSLIVASRHFGDEDTVRIQSVLGRGLDPDLQALVLSLGIADLEGPARVTAPTHLGAKPRICAPVRCAGVLLGFLWLIDDGRVTDDDLRDTAIVADKAGIILYRRELSLQRRQARGGSLVRDLISADAPTRAAAEVEALDDELIPPNAELSVSVIRPVEMPGDSGASTPPLTLLAQQAISMSTDPVILCLPRPHDLVVLVAHAREDSAESTVKVMQRLTSSVTERLGVSAITGVGTQQLVLTEAHRSYQEALVAVRAAQFLPGMGEVVTWASLGVYAMLAKLDPQEITMGAHPTPLVRLASSKNGEVLLGTAETFLDLAGSVQRSAEALHVHRATLYQRLARIEEVTGLDLDDGGDRLTLHLGLKLARLTGALPRRDPAKG